MLMSINPDQLITEQYPNIPERNIVLQIDIHNAEADFVDAKPQPKRTFMEYSPLEIQKIPGLAG